MRLAAKREIVALPILASPRRSDANPHSHNCHDFTPLNRHFLMVANGKIPAKKNGGPIDLFQQSIGRGEQ
jgi:hypothetical protein